MRLVALAATAALIVGLYSLPHLLLGWPHAARREVREVRTAASTTAVLHRVGAHTKVATAQPPARNMSDPRAARSPSPPPEPQGAWYSPYVSEAALARAPVLRYPVWWAGPFLSGSGAALAGLGRWLPTRLGHRLSHRGRAIG